MEKNKYYELNKDKIRIQQKMYYKLNKDKLIKYQQKKTEFITINESKHIIEF